MARSLFDINAAKDNAAWLSGVFTAVQSETAPLWIDARNVVFQDEVVRKLKGWENFFVPPWVRTNVNVPRPTSEVINALAQDRDGGFRRLYFATLDTVWTFDGNRSYRRLGTGFGGFVSGTQFEPPTRWSLEPFGRFLLATNGVDQPQIWRNNGAGSILEPLPTPFTTAQIFLNWRAFVLAFNTSSYSLDGGVTTTGGPQHIAWCSIDDVDAWIPDPANQAGDLTLRDLESEIVAAVPLQETIAVYGFESMHIVSFLGDPFYFGAQRALDGIGAVGKNSVVSVGSENFGLGRQGFWRTDGVQFTYIDKPAIWRQVQETTNWSQAAKTACFHDEENYQVVWYVPSGTSSENNIGYAYNYINRSWSIHDRGFSAAINRQVFDFPITADTSGFLFFKNKGLNDGNGALEAFVQTKPLSLEVDDFYKYLDRVKLKLRDLDGDVRLRVGVQEYLDQPIEWLQLESDVVDEASREIYLRRSAVYWTFRLEAAGIGSDFSWAGLQGFGQIDGERSG